MSETPTPEQEAQAQQIEDQLLAEARVQCRQIARLLASKDNSQLLGEAEFQVRDHVHQIGARALDAALETRKKSPTPDAV